LFGQIKKDDFLNDLHYGIKQLFADLVAEELGLAEPAVIIKKMADALVELRQ
jgi:hypothetical protein